MLKISRPNREMRGIDSDFLYELSVGSNVTNNNFTGSIPPPCKPNSASKGEGWKYKKHFQKTHWPPKKRISSLDSFSIEGKLMDLRFLGFRFLDYVRVPLFEVRVLHLGFVSDCFGFVPCLVLEFLSFWVQRFDTFGVISKSWMLGLSVLGIVV